MRAYCLELCRHDETYTPTGGDDLKEISTSYLSGILSFDNSLLTTGFKKKEAGQAKPSPAQPKS